MTAATLRSIRGAGGYRAGERVREQLIEAAGMVFAGKGYDRATSREICEIAGTNFAAVNYHFGGIDALYVEALRRAHQGIVTVDAVRQIVESRRPPKEKLLAYLGPIVRSLADPDKRPWHMRLVCREILAPTGLRDAVVATEVQPKTDYLRGIIAEMIGADYDEPIVGEALLTVIAPVLIMATAAHPSLQMLAPSRERPAEKAEALSAHYERFILGGLAAVTKAYRARRRHDDGQLRPPRDRSVATPQRSAGPGEPKQRIRRPTQRTAESGSG